MGKGDDIIYVCDAATPYVANGLSVYVCVLACMYAYCILGKFCKFGKSSMIRKTKTIQIDIYN